MFPKYKTFLFFKTPDGWEDLGRIEAISHEIKDDHLLTNYIVCGLCFEKGRMGRENGKIFKFCPRCLIKLIHP